MVKIRKAVESMYRDLCKVTVHAKYTKDNGATGFRDEVLFDNTPCHISIESVVASSQTESSGNIVQAVKLFVSPDLTIPTGSKIEVKHDGVVGIYRRSGEPAIHSTHQEIALELFDRWS